MEETLGQLTSARHGSTIGFGWRDTWPTGEQIAATIQQTPEKAAAIANAGKRYAEAVHQYHSARSLALEGLRKKQSALFSEPFTLYGEILLEDPTIRAELYTLRRARWEDADAKGCLVALGKALAATGRGKNPKATPSVVDAIRERYQVWYERGCYLKRLWQTPPYRRAWKRVHFLQERGYTKERAQTLVEEFINRPPSEWARKQTAREAEVSEEVVRRAVLVKKDNPV